MSIKVSIKLDNMKIRVFFEGNDATINEIENYLKSKEYKRVDQCLQIEAKTREMEPSGYSIPSYSMAYKMNGDENKKNLLIEAWFKLTTSFDDKNLAQTIEDLIKPILPIMNMDIPLPKPNMKVTDLKSRHYVTVFEQENTPLDSALKLVQTFESVVLDVRKNAGLNTDKIPSDVNVSFEKVPSATHVKGLAVFGLMPTPTSASSSNTAYSNPYTSSSKNL